MRSIQRKLAVLGVSVLAMGLMAVGASSAQALEGHLEVSDGQTFELCPDLVVEGNEVSGGCLVEDMEGEFAFKVQGSVFEVWDAGFDMRIDGDGDWYAVDQWMFGTGWGRQPCEDPETGETIPWTGTSVPTTIDFCVEPIGGGSDYTEVVPFEAEVVLGSLMGLTQKTDPETGIDDAEFQNLGWESDEIYVEWVYEEE